MNDDPMYDPMYDRDRDLDRGYDPDYDPDQDPSARRTGNQGRGAEDKRSGKAPESWDDSPDENDVIESQRKQGQGGVDQGFEHDIDDTYDQ